jgi:hypothetical protein
MSKDDDKLKVQVSGRHYLTTPSDGCQIILKDHGHLLENVKTFWSSNGYVNVFYKDSDGCNRGRTMQSFLYEKVTNSTIPEGLVVHHKNGIRYDNSFNNLEVVTYSYNNTATTSRKTVESSSQYKGVCWSKKSQKWLASISSGQRQGYLGLFTDEMEAAIRYDQAFVAIHNTDQGSNGLLPEDEVSEILTHKEKYLPSKCERELPKCISLTSAGSYRVQIKRGDVTTSKCFPEFIDAVNYKEEFLKREKEEKQQQIQRNEEGVAIIPVKLLKSTSVVYALVDDSDYHTLIERTWFLGANGYAFCGIGTMHLTLLPSRSHKCVDHINHSKLDNRRSNLRYVSLSFNSRNKRKRDGCSSQYVGVHWNKKTELWHAEIIINGKKKKLGRYILERDAAAAYEKEYIKLETIESNNS